MSYASKNIGCLIVSVFLVISGCKSSSNLAEAESNVASNGNQQEVVSAADEEVSAEPIIVSYQNHSSNIKIALDPNKDQFYLNLSGMTPQEKDSIIVQDSTMIENRAIDIQTLLASYRKAQDLFYLEEYREALEEVDKTLEIQETADAYALKGTIFFMLENITAARANWNRAVQMDPNIPVPSIPELETLIDEIRGEGN